MLAPKYQSAASKVYSKSLYLNSNIKHNMSKGYQCNSNQSQLHFLKSNLSEVMSILGSGYTKNQLELYLEIVVILFFISYCDNFTLVQGVLSLSLLRDILLHYLKCHKSGYRP